MLIDSCIYYHTGRQQPLDVNEVAIATLGWVSALMEETDDAVVHRMLSQIKVGSLVLESNFRSTFNDAAHA